MYKKVFIESPYKLLKKLLFENKSKTKKTVLSQNNSSVTSAAKHTSMHQSDSLNLEYADCIPW